MIEPLSSLKVSYFALMVPACYCLAKEALGSYFLNLEFLVDEVDYRLPVSDILELKLTVLPALLISFPLQLMELFLDLNFCWIAYSSAFFLQYSKCL